MKMLALSVNRNDGKRSEMSFEKLTAQNENKSNYLKLNADKFAYAFHDERQLLAFYGACVSVSVTVCMCGVCVRLIGVTVARTIALVFIRFRVAQNLW